MAADFDKQLFFDNISYLLKQKGMRIGELESKAGVSTGYISRTSKDANVKPGIDFIVNAASALDVSLDALIHMKFSDQSSTEKYISSFIEKLTRDTLNEQLFWNVESAAYLNNLKAESFLDIHFLFTEDTYEEIDVNEQLQPVYGHFWKFPSHSYGDTTFIGGDCFNVPLDREIFLYLMNVDSKEVDSSDLDDLLKTEDRIELWICNTKDSKREFLAYNKKDNDYISKQVTRLYQAVTEYMKKPRVSRDFRSAIDAYMGSDKKSADDGLDS